jgi:VWFA-related protein
MLRSTIHLVFGIALFLLFTCSVFPAQEPLLRTTTQLVEIDTIAIDSHGKPVTDLKTEDFRLFEDGIERPLSHFSFEKIEPLDPKAVQRLHELAQNQKPGVYANFNKNTAPVPLNGCTVLLIDWLNTPLELQKSAQDELNKFIETVDLSKPLAIYALDSGLRQVQNFTSDRQVLRANVEKYGLHNTNLQPEKTVDNSLHSQTTDFRVMNSATALLGIASVMRGMQGHKSLIWLSGSFPAALNPTNRKGMKWQMEVNQGGWLFGDPRDYTNLMTKVSHVFSEANIAVYPVDAMGLQGTMADASDDFRYLINPMQQNISERQQGMRDVADLTGGRAFYNHNNIGNEIAGAYEDASTFYALAFTPARNKPDGKVHSVRVECLRPGVHVRYRKSYFADDKQALAQIKHSELELLVQSLGHTAEGLPFMAQLDKQKPDKQQPDKQQNDRLKLWLDGSGLTLQNGPSPFIAVDIGIATFDGQGNLLQQNYTGMKIKLTEAQMREVQISGLAQTLQFTRSKESACVRVVLRDLASGRIGTLEVPLQ